MSDLHKRLDRELGQLKHQTRAERELWGIVRRGTPIPRRVIRELAAELDRLPSAQPTPAERELLARLA